MITERDMKVVEFIEKYKIATTTTLSMFYPNINIAQRRLKVICEDGYLRRSRNNVNNEYMYYLKKPNQIRHDLLLTEFYYNFRNLEGIEIIDFKKEVAIGNVRADGMVAYKHKDKNYLALLEMQLKYNTPDVDKYLKLHKNKEYKNHLPVFPQIVFVTNRSIKKIDDFKVIKVKKDLSDIKKIIGGFNDEK